jgi:hypothetical protein
MHGSCTTAHGRTLKEVRRVAIASLGHLRRRGSFPDLSQRTFAHIRFEAVDERHAVQVGTPTMAGDIIEKAPKTEAGRRTVTVPSNVLPALERHLDRFVAPADQQDDLA